MIKYKIRVDLIYSEEYGCYKSYGVDVISNKAIINSIKDISLNKKPLKKLIRMCNHLKLSEIHIYDVVDDFLAKCQKAALLRLLTYELFKFIQSCERV